MPVRPIDPSRRHRIGRLVVAVPARNEAATVAACLRSIDQAARRTVVPTTIVLAADSCVDGTVARARAAGVGVADLVVIEGAWDSVGAARAAAVAAGLQSRGAPLDRTSLDGTWIANTDADCVVPRHWLSLHVDLAERFDAVAGVVRLDPDTTPAGLLTAFEAGYLLDGARHHHVHGANLGVRASSLDAAGGWCRTALVGEDHLLWDRLRSIGCTMVHSVGLHVTTSSRTEGRVEGGFASDLRRLAFLAGTS